MLTSCGCFLLKNICVGVSLILSIAKFLRASILKNICERLLLKLRKIKIYSQGVFSTSTTETSSLLVFRDWFSVKFVFRYNNYLVW